MNMWQEGSILPVKLIFLALPFPHSSSQSIAIIVAPQVPSDQVQIRTNSEGVQMVYGTCPILVEGNEYIFRCRMI